jgi:hypothetical protein
LKLILIDPKVITKTFTSKIAHESKCKEKSNLYSKKQQKHTQKKKKKTNKQTNKQKQQTTTTPEAREAKVIGWRVIDEMELFCVDGQLRSHGAW